MSRKVNIDLHVNSKINGYYVSGKNNSQLVCNQLNALDFNRYENLPIGGVKFNWITRSIDIDWSTFDSNFQILNHIYNEKHLSNKGLLVNNLKNYDRHIRKIDNYLPLNRFLPETYLLDNITDRINFKKAFENNSIWICKPVGLSCGREIFIFRNENQLENILNECHKNLSSYSTIYYNRLVQKYIENPLLIHKHKFDIRTYFLCICLSNDILCFACQTGYLRLSMYEYDLDNFDKFIHLTNQSIQRKNQDFSSMKNHTGMTMEEFNEYFNECIQPNMSNIDKDWVINELPGRITKILNQVAHSIRNKLVIREGCFGFYGVDILIDDKLNCWLLEINSGPTLDMTNTALEKVIPMCFNVAISILRKLFSILFNEFSTNLDIVTETLEKYRSSGVIFPLQESNLFKYLPLSNNFDQSHHIPTFTSFNNHLINLTPGVFTSIHRYRRSLFSSDPHKYVHKALIQKKRSKLSREHLSHHLTKLIQINNKS
ncbi:unnamed protein product [Adineta steineri]|nr:unnamed protein product [Adineta steineri]CAF3648293.1 unnamed protein product [Adineta steineri]CAF4058525.1 unnamed protein product [Adineta steineri]